MSRETEKIFADFEKFLNAQNADADEDEMQELLAEFINKYNEGSLNLPYEERDKVWDLLEQAYDAETEEEAVKYAKKALKRDKNCLDAKLLIVGTYDAEKQKSELEKAIALEEKRLIDEEVVDQDDIGEYYGILWTRPLIRAKAMYAQLLEMMGKNNLAVQAYEEIIRLNENDNTGARYQLMNLYALLENKEKAENLDKKYEHEKTLAMLLPQALLYYKLDDMKKATKLAKLILKNNKYFAQMLNEEIPEKELDKAMDVLESGMIEMNSLSEVISAMGSLPGGPEFNSGFLEWLAEKAYENREVKANRGAQKRKV